MGELGLMKSDVGERVNWRVWGRKGKWGEGKGKERLKGGGGVGKRKLRKENDL